MKHSFYVAKLTNLLCLFQVRLLVLIGVCFFFNNSIIGQCTNSSAYPTAAVVAPTPGNTVTIATQQWQNEYSTISTVAAGTTYISTYSNGGYITVRSGTFNGAVVAAGNSPLTWTATVSGTHYVHYNTNSSCGTATNGNTSSIQALNIPCSGTPNGGTATITSLSGCTGINFTLSATGLSSGSGLTYQWQSAPSASGPWTNITGGTTASFVTSVASQGITFYQLISTCAGVSSISTSVSYNATPCVLLTNNVQYITSCNTTVYDSGGATGNYTNNQERSIIIRPTSMDQVITVTGTYSTESNYDYVSIDEGEDSNPYTSFIDYSGNGTITPFTTSGPGIPLVIHFTSDGGTVGAGFALTISCACAKPTSISLTATAAPCGGTGSVTVNSVSALDQKPWVMTTFEGDILPTLPWLPTAPPNAWISGNAANLNGNNNMMRLTQAQNSQNGALVFQSYGENQAELLGYFDILIDDNGVGDGSADGMSFSYGPNIATTPVATNGAYESGVGQGVIISFDTYNSGAAFPNCNGTNYSNIYLIYNTTVLACFSTVNTTFFRGNQNLCSFYISPTGLFNFTINVNGTVTNVFSGVQLPASYLSDDKSTWKAALAARTGGVNDRHRVDNINLYHYYDYEYSINGTSWQTSPTFTGLAVGNYTMYVRLKGITTCSYTQAFTISSSGVLTPAITGNTNLCWDGTTTLTAEYPTGGTVTEEGGYRTHTFTTNGTLTVPAGFSGNAEVLVVAGGGGGGSARGGGGGAGGLLYNSNFSLTAATSYPVTIGAGGAAETNGSNSVFSTLTAVGGGRGGSHNGNSAVVTNNGQSGGSGGGAAMNYNSNIFAGGTATAGQGFNGATSGTAGTDNPRNTGGGGGAGQAGTPGAGGNATWTTGTAPKGGDGLFFPQFSTIAGSPLGWFAGGGGGSRGGADRQGAPAGAGGQGGGGAGQSTAVGTAGVANTGGGGGGSESTGGAGGSGIVIVRYYIGTTTWSSQNPAVATVSNGVVTGVAPGGSTIIDFTIASVGCPDIVISTPVNVIGGQRIVPTGPQCSGTELNFEALPNPSVSGTTISWTVTTPVGLTASTTSGSANLFSTTLTNSTSGTLQPTITVTQTLGLLTCVRNFTPNILAPPTVQVTCSPICQGGTTTVTATPTPAGTYNYTWTVPGSFTNPGDVSSFSTGTAGQYSVIINDPTVNCPSTEQSCTISILASPSVVFLSPP